MLQWPDLSRKPAIKTRTSTVDPTLRDQMQNGAEATALQFGRGREQYDVTIEAMPDADVQALKTFVRDAAVYGTQPFAFPDERVKANPRTLIVKFGTLPSYSDLAAVSDDGEGIQQNCTFTLREV